MNEDEDFKPPAEAEGGAENNGGAGENGAAMDSETNAATGANNNDGAGGGDEGQISSPSGSAGMSGGGGGGGNLYLRPVFLGNLSHGCLAADVENIFTNPAPTGLDSGEVKMPYPVERVVS